MSSFPQLFEPMLGGLGFGMGGYVRDSGDPKPPALAPPIVQQPTRRPYSMPYGFAGQYPGYGLPGPMNLLTCWAMRRYPMVVKVHARLVMPILAGSRSIEIEDDGGDEETAAEIKKAAEQDLLPMLARAMPGAMEAPHFGRWLQEVIWDKPNGRISPVDVQSILPQEGVIHADDFRRFTGYQVASDDFRDARYGFLCVHHPHIDPVLGESCNMAALTSWFRSTKSAENADAVERKASGIQLLMHIMQGVTLYDANGQVMDDKAVAEFFAKYMNAAVSGQSAVLPDMAFPKEAIQNNPELAKIPLVRVDRFDWGNMGPTLEAHLSRKRDLDVDICSAWGVPERAVMESEHGSRADAESHSDVVLCISEMLHASACEQWDQQVTKRWFNANFAGSKVRIKTIAAPLSDPQQSFLQQLTTALASNQQAAPEIIANLDKRKLLERVEVPVVSEDDAKKNLADAESKQQEADAIKAKQMQGNPDRMKQMNGENGNGKASSK